jgi:hypothetical protein
MINKTFDFLFRHTTFLKLNFFLIRLGLIMVCIKGHATTEYSLRQGRILNLNDEP